MIDTEGGQIGCPFFVALFTSGYRDLVPTRIKTQREALLISQWMELSKPIRGKSKHKKTPGRTGAVIVEKRS